MLDRVYVRTHTGFAMRPLDVGALAEACLFYGSTDLVLNRGSLRQLLDIYGADTVVAFVREGYVKAHFLSHDIGVKTEDSNGPNERHRPIMFQVGSESQEAKIVDQFRQSTGKSGLGSRRALAFLEAIHPLEIDLSWQTGMDAAFRDERLMQQAISCSASHAMGPHTRTHVVAENVTETTDGYFRLRLGSGWGELREQYSAIRGEVLTEGHLLVHLVEILTDLQLASRLQSEISTGQLGSEFLLIKCREIEAAAAGNRAKLAEFQSYVLNGRDVRTAINSGKESLDDLMKLLDRSRRFRHWIDDKPIETDLVAAYLNEVTADTWASKLTAKAVRLVVLVGTGSALGGHLGVAAGAALSAADMFLTDRVASGWRPNQFVEEDLDPFVSE